MHTSIRSDVEYQFSLEIKANLGETQEMKSFEIKLEIKEYLFNRNLLMMLRQKVRIKLLKLQNQRFIQCFHF